jgi:diguanylate cyclase (GGDEF)-like protein
MPVFILFFSLLITDSISSHLISALNLKAEFYWFEAITNASILALVSLLILRFIIIVSRQIRPSEKVREWLYLQVGISVFGIGLSLTLLQKITGLLGWNLIPFVDLRTLAFSSISSLAIYIYVFKPTVHPITCFLNKLEVRYSTSYLFGVTLLLLFLINIYQTQSADVEEKIIQNEAEQLVLIEKALSYRIAEAVLDTRTLASQPDFVRHLAGSITATEEVELEFKNIVDIKHSYDQIRFIDHQGLEQVRINKGEYQIEIVPQEELQNKQDRYYVPETGRLNHGKVYISPLDLNVEHGEIEIPFKPITRIATPVKNSLSQLLGLIIINLNASHLIQHLEDAQSLSQGQIMMLNQQGFWIHGEDKDKLWSFMYPNSTQPSLAKLNPELWQALSTHTSGSLKQEGSYYVFHRVQLNQEPRIQKFEQHDADWPKWILITHIKPEKIALSSLHRLKLMLVFSLLLIVVSGVGTYLYACSQLKRNSAENKVKHMAEHDPLTGLFNRRTLMQQLDITLKQIKLSKEQLAILYLDLDNFKPINDRFGHEAGDQALKHVSQRISQMLRSDDLLARIGGDEFVILIRNPESRQHLEEIAQRIINKLNESLHIGDQQYHLGVSIGIVVTRDHHESRDDLLKAADLLMLEAKEKGKNRYHFSHL